MVAAKFIAQYEVSYSGEETPKSATNLAWDNGNTKDCKLGFHLLEKMGRKYR